MLSHATQWASDVVVIDKSSTDRTAAMAAEFGPQVRVIQVPFSSQGETNAVEWVRYAKHDWIFVGTCSEVPTRKLIAVLTQVLATGEQSYDLVMVPRRMYSLGIHHPTSPWSVAYYPFLFHRQRAVITDKIHEHFKARDSGRVYTIPYADDCCVHHFTHPTAQRFVDIVTEYAKVETTVDRDPELAILDCFKRLRTALPGIFRTGADWPGILAAWGIYNLTNVLFIWEKSRGVDVPERYRQLTAEILRDQWGIGSKDIPTAGSSDAIVTLEDETLAREGRADVETAVLVSYWAASLLFGLRHPKTVLTALVQLPRLIAARAYRKVFPIVPGHKASRAH